MLDLTLLTKEQIFDGKLPNIFEKKATTMPITEFAILLGANFFDCNRLSDVEKDKRFGYYWTKTPAENGKVFAVHKAGVEEEAFGTIRSFGVLPVISYSSIKNKCKNKTKTQDEITVVEYGEYPQYVAPKKIQEELNDQINELNPSFTITSKTYTVDSRKYDDESLFKPCVLQEYEYKGKKYVKVKANTCFSGMEIEFTNGAKYRDGDNVWVEVEPVKWLIDEENDLAISERILLSGVLFDITKNYKGDFKNSNLKTYMDIYLSKDIFPEYDLNKTIDINTDKDMTLKNGYEFNFKEVSEEDLIRGSLESNIAPFLHGKSSEGKSARIKEFDPDAEIVYLRNATPDSLNGKSVYNSKKNEMIDVPPTWYVKLKEKCEKEPDKLHIVFFDELTNALPSIQGMAFNIILDKEINGKWKLPENARVAAAGNDLEDSLAANTMAEPLFNRFNHVYINTTVEDWLKWALTPNNTYERLDYKKEDTSKQLKIHPAIYTYITFKKDEVLRTKYTGVKPNADPRKWEMASKVLYQTNNPYMLRGLIGEELTNDFASFCKTKVITLEDVINGNYDNKIFEINSSEKYLTTLALSNVDETNLEIVRNFIERFGKEYLALFDSLWTIGDDERLEKLMDLKKGVSLCIKKK